jgi:hypothetical protein
MSDQDAEDSPFFMTINVRCSTGNIHEFSLKVEGSMTVDQLKQQIKNHLKVGENQNLRVIYQGKLLGPDSYALEATDLKHDCYVHCVISPKPVSQILAAATSSSSDIEMTTLNASGSRRGLASLPRLSGDEIAALRVYFRDSIEQFAQQQSIHRENDESEEDFRDRLEEQWMATQGPQSEFRLNLAISSDRPQLSRQQLAVLMYGEGLVGFHPTSEHSHEIGSLKDFFYGMLLGYLLGFMMIFCIWDVNVSYRQKLGILCGIILQSILFYFHTHYEKPTTTTTITNGANTSNESATTTTDTTSTNHLRGSY